MTDAAAPIHVPSPEAAAASRMAAFWAFCARETGNTFAGWNAFHRWSAACWPDFWRLFLQWSAPDVEGDPDPACEGEAIETATFFPGLRLSYAWNLLRPLPGAGDDAPALVAVDETGRREAWTRGQLRRRVESVARALRARGVGPGDHVVAIARNDDAAVVACLAATGLGATWSSIGPDQGVDAVLARFRQLDPCLLLAVGSRPYQGQANPLRERLEAVVAGLPTARALVALDGDEAALDGLGKPVLTLHGLEAEGADGPFDWPRVPFNHPLFVMFSSGTTGLPKCIVHGTGGTLLEHLKEQRLHSDLKPGDRLLFTTSCGWMMWNWQLSALAAGAAIIAYDGSPTHPTPDALWRVVAAEGATVFGTSPAFLQFSRDAGIVPRATLDLSRLRAVQSTGSVLAERHYDWVRENVGGLPLQSISGGTDIIGCFVLGNPMLPVHRGESQCLSLGMDVRALKPADAPEDATGELVCASPFPSRPLRFHNDPDGSRFHGAYFAQNEGLWTHGDFVQLTPHGGARILGRSDGVMNIRGIRIGPAEIYAVLADFPEIRTPMAVEQQAPDEAGGSRLVLLLVMADGAVLDRALALRIKKEISRRASMAHVPSVLVAVEDLPATHNGKLSERAARDAVCGRVPANLLALRNPACVEALRVHPELGGRGRRDTAGKEGA
jgi:acetoacetyl-CoA synthetase